jgi:hypothetical protein
MREAFFILLVLVVLFSLTAYRYRRQIRFAREIWRTMKSVRKLHTDGVPQVAEKPESGDLVNCSRCGSWTPESTSIKFGPTIYYCSTKCLQSKAKV